MLSSLMETFGHAWMKYTGLSNSIFPSSVYQGPYLPLKGDLSKRFSMINPVDMSTTRPAPIVVRWPTEKASTSYSVRFLTSHESTHEGQVAEGGRLAIVE